MTILYIPSDNKELTINSEISDFLKNKGIKYEQWKVEGHLDSHEEVDILKRYKDHLQNLMTINRYQSADTISVNEWTPNLPAIREKFLREHTHIEDEVRFFVEGEGLFWFNVENTVFSLLCTAGDLLAVPAGYKHWFDLGPQPNVTAIRIFTSPEGWVAQYTNSGIEEQYNGMKW